VRSKKPGTPPSGEAPHTPENADTSELQAHELEDTAPVTPSPHLLSPAHQRFAQEFIVDLNGTKAYQRVYPDAQYDSARTEASRLLANPNIRREVQRLLDERAVVTGITADRVLCKWWEMATADPRELVEVRVGSCRHCWGMYHQWQYTEREWEKVLSDHVHAEVKRRKVEGERFEARTCPEKGGIGYTPNRPPNADCPECHGDGEPRAIIKDMANASPGALALFGGIKYDKAGNLIVAINDARQQALKLVAEHLNMLSGKDKAPTESDPLMALLEEIRGAHGAGSSLAIVHEDPEAAPPRDVQDVTPKAEVSRRKPEPGSGFDLAKPKTWRAKR
jgi:phage terminase small subunit